jgi:hypothetical protein
MKNTTWGKKHLERIKKKAGARYTPKLNVDLPTSEIFDGISKTNKFYTDIRKKYGELLRELNYIQKKYNDQDSQKHYNKFAKKIKDLLKILSKIHSYNTKKISWKSIENQTEKLKSEAWNLIKYLDENKDKAKKSNDLNYDNYHVRKIQDIIGYFNNLSKSPKAKLSNRPFLLLKGSGGIGKTHLLCDVAEKRFENKELPTFFLFGESFTNKKSFWTQFSSQLQLKEKVKTKIIKKIDSIGKKSKCRSIIIIDALNENTIQSPRFWKKNLDNILNEIKKYPNIALVVSLRNGYERDVVFKKTQKRFIEFEHYGFPPEILWDALNHFFKEYNIKFPEVPLLHPEFYNPLFLKFFCEKNKNSKLSLKGGNALKDIFEDFVIKIGLEVLKEFNPKSKKRDNGKNILWDGIVKDMALWMAKNGKTNIPNLDLKTIVGNYFPKQEKRVIDLMQRRVIINELELNNNTYYTFSYNKFSDHIIVRQLLCSFKDSKQRKKSFEENGEIWKAIQNFKYDHGILEALCIWVPEFFKKEKKKELFELAPYVLNNNNFEYPFRESLIWRDPKTIDNKIVKIVEKNIKQKDDFFLEPILSLASFPDNKLNARLLNSILCDFSMPERDSWWSVFLHHQQNDQGAVDRILQWSWSEQDKSNISDESIFLISTTLAWFMTTPNRFIRDKATKGMVCLLQDRLNLIIPLLNKFKKVNDPYVTERLFAVSYGCILRNKDDKPSLKLLTNWILDNVFQKNPPLNILTRDYAKGIIDIASRRGIKINKNKSNPPYKSTWPKKITSIKKLENKYKNNSKIWYSVMYHFGTLGDFGNYVVKHGVENWSGRDINKPETKKSIVLDRFKKDLSKEQKKLLEKIMGSFSKINLLKAIENIEIKFEDFSKKDLDKRKKEEEEEKKKAIKDFENSISKTKQKFFKKELKPFLNDNGTILDPLDRFDSKLAQKWILERTMKLGYDQNIHGKFDDNLHYYSNSGRTSHKAERIGKKYQWIAYHEFLALLSDHFEFKGESWNNKGDKYKGAWKPYVRDIDPSFTLKNKDIEKDLININNWKSNQGYYNGWENQKTNNLWLKNTKDLPNPKKIIEMVDDDNEKWLMLEGFIDWEETLKPEDKKYETPTRELWYMIKSYIVKKKDQKAFLQGLTGKDFHGRWMPESHEFYETFIGEYPNSDAFKDLRGNYNIWTKVERGKEKISIPIVVTDDCYLNEFTLDCSNEDSISIKLPSKWIVNRLKLNHNFLDGRFYDKNKKLVITISRNPSSLLINKRCLLEFLRKNDYVIFWTVLGEKQIIGESSGNWGRLDINGVYYSNNTNIIGKLNKKFNS